MPMDVLDDGENRTLDAIRESEERYRVLVESSGGLVQSITPEGRFLFVSSNWLSTFGYTQEEVDSLTLFDLIHPDSMAHCQDLFGQIMGGESVVPIEAKFVTKQGACLFVEGTATARRHDGEVVATHALLHDVSAQKRAEVELEHVRAELVQAQKMDAMGRLSSGVAHDFNNMLAVILGNAECVLERLPSRDPLRGLMGEIISASERSAELTQSLLTFARNQVVAPMVIDLNAVIGRMHSLLCRAIGEGIELKTKQAADLGSVRVDPGQMEQVVLNLTINARDAMPGGGEIVIETANVTQDAAYCQGHAASPPGGYVRLSVHDTGCGMDAETREKIFEPFFTTKRSVGTGLGLATVFGIVEQHGGHIEAHSSPGAGTTFEIDLPRVEDRPDADSP
jgi:two-component system cell cycle sensor histidine kinase/response regulator CckA